MVYWFFQYVNTATKDLRPFLQSFLQQLSSSKDKGFPPKVVQWLLKHSGENPLPSQEDFLGEIQEAIKGLESDIFVVLDGLDVFSPSEETGTKNTGRKEVLDLICDLIKDANANLHVLLTSKESDIEKRWQEDPDFVIVDSMDIQPVLEAEVQDFLKVTLEDPEGVFQTKHKEMLSDITTHFDSGEKRYCPNSILSVLIYALAATASIAK